MQSVSPGLGGLSQDVPTTPGLADPLACRRRHTQSLRSLGWDRSEQSPAQASCPPRSSALVQAGAKALRTPPAFSTPLGGPPGTRASGGPTSAILLPREWGMVGPDRAQEGHRALCMVCALFSFPLTMSLVSPSISSVCVIVRSCCVFRLALNIPNEAEAQTFRHGELLPRAREGAGFPFPNTPTT